MQSRRLGWKTRQIISFLFYLSVTSRCGAETIMMERRASDTAVFALICSVRRFWEAIRVQLKKPKKPKRTQSQFNGTVAVKW